MVDVCHNFFSPFFVHHSVCGSFGCFLLLASLSQFMTHLAAYLCAHPIESFHATLFGQSDDFIAAINWLFWHKKLHG